MLATRIITLLLWTSVSCSTIRPPTQSLCKDVVKPLDRLDPLDFAGRWAMVADSIHSSQPTALSDSTTIDFFNSTFSKTNRYGEECLYLNRNISDISIEGPNYSFNVGNMYTLHGTFFQTSCSDCALVSFKVESDHFKSDELCLFSKRREVGETELKEFAAVVACMMMPAHVVMDPTKELCPVHSG